MGIVSACRQSVVGVLCLRRREQPVGRGAVGVLPGSCCRQSVLAGRCGRVVGVSCCRREGRVDVWAVGGVSLLPGIF